MDGGERRKEWAKWKYRNGNAFSVTTHFLCFNNFKSLNNIYLNDLDEKIIFK